jgi:hypothetical protein
LINSNPKFKPVVKDRLFYNRFEYAIGFTLQEASALRDLRHDEIDLTMERRREWIEIAHQRWHKTGTMLGRQHNIISRRRTEITDKTTKDLHDLAELLLTTTADYKLVVSVNQGHVYTNDLNLIDQLNQLDFLANKYYSHAQVDRPENTIRLKNSRHQYRSYFKIIKLTAVQKDHLMDFLYNQQDYVRVSPALQRWIDQPFNRTQDYFFVDYNSSSWLTMLALVNPGLIRKTMQIIPAK